MGRIRFAPQTGDALYPGVCWCLILALRAITAATNEILSQLRCRGERRRSADSHCWQPPIPISTFSHDFTALATESGLLKLR